MMALIPPWPAASCATVYSSWNCQEAFAACSVGPEPEEAEGEAVEGPPKPEAAASAASPNSEAGASM
jgi:hypothetical protein